MMKTLNLSLLRDLQGVIYFNTEIPNGAFQLGVAQQKLDGPQIFGPLVNECRLGPPHGVRAIDRRIEAGGSNPMMNDPSVLSR